MVTQRDIQQITDAINSNSLSENDKEKAVKLLENLNREVLQRRLVMLDVMASRDLWRRTAELALSIPPSKDV